MAIMSMGSYSGADCNGMKHNESSSDLVAMLGPCSRSSPSHVGLQVVAPALLVEEGVRALHKRSYGASFDGPTVEDGAELDGDEGGDELSPNLEKKRRLTFDQVRSLERNFEMENKLEPERKMQLAKELGLRPRQVAVWFQNRRARWKTKQLERDYETLAADYERLKADYEHVLGEKKHLKAEVQRLSGGDGDHHCPPAVELSAQPGQTEAAASAPLVSRHQNSRSSPTVDVSLACASGSSDVLDADSPRTTDSSSCSAQHRIGDHSPDVLPPESSFLGDPTVILQPLDGVSVKLEDGPGDHDFHELVDQSCNYLLMQLDEQSDVLPWWDWP